MIGSDAMRALHAICLDHLPFKGTPVAPFLAFLFNQSGSGALDQDNIPFAKEVKEGLSNYRKVSQGDYTEIMPGKILLHILEWHYGAGGGHAVALRIDIETLDDKEIEYIDAIRKKLNESTQEFILATERDETKKNSF